VGNFEARILEVEGMRITRVLMTTAEPASIDQGEEG
jgi:hypothetical protein